ncbi:NmrA family NAD(P)-binding protein [Dinghuibacter silviterrae]|uniref:Uncharacterized protein YbjT (DUF2867 family) n=1 Tax=Dinghuibacter silviterrae TaxID=1539049 RepID=A0A4R8DN46_9BACT|nr:NAD(P)H-binding protein [Dinghuibacter silviterrae]TDW99117.1 uncharacterized protein YbjT (DUF2867 family) [Dinghuibacter silviterrae]
MKITVTGSLGNISQPLTKTLVQQGHQVTVISSKQDKQKDIEALGATAAIGSVEDVRFLTAAFTGADAVYLMNPPNFAEPDPIAYYRRVAGNYALAIRQTGVRRVVYLSSYGADLDKGTGIILGSHHAENILKDIPGITLTLVRPTYFYYNLYVFLQKIKTDGVIRANYGEDKVVMVSPKDIAAAVAEEIVSAAEKFVPQHGKSNVRYVASDEATGQEIASILGAAIGKPDLKWEVVSDEQMHKNYVANGLPKNTADHLVELFESLRTGKLAEDFNLHRPAVFGSEKLTGFAKEFARVYQQN